LGVDGRLVERGAGRTVCGTVGGTVGLAVAPTDAPGVKTATVVGPLATCGTGTVVGGTVVWTTNVLVELVDDAVDEDDGFDVVESYENVVTAAELAAVVGIVSTEGRSVVNAVGSALRPMPDTAPLISTNAIPAAATVIHRRQRCAESGNPSRRHR
jgi:hypothetical protein